MKPSLDREMRLYDALKRITAYLPPDKLKRVCEKEYGLHVTEAIEYAYANVLLEAKRAIHGMRRPVALFTEAELAAAKKRAAKLDKALKRE